MISSALSGDAATEKPYFLLFVQIEENSPRAPYLPRKNSLGRYERGGFSTSASPCPKGKGTLPFGRTLPLGRTLPFGHTLPFGRILPFGRTLMSDRDTGEALPKTLQSVLN